MDDDRYRHLRRQFGRTIVYLLLTIILLLALLVCFVLRIYNDWLESISDHVSLGVMRALYAIAVVVAISVAVAALALEINSGKESKQGEQRARMYLRRANAARSRDAAPDAVQGEDEGTSQSR